MSNPLPRPLRVFLCHSSGDKPTVRKLYQKLSSEGWIDVWLDEEKLLAGQDWDYEIGNALDNSDAVIVTLSTGSVSKEGYVQKELRFVLDIALEKPEGTIFILPVRLNDCERPRRLQSIQGIDYFPPKRREWAYSRLKNSLAQRASTLGVVTMPFESTAASVKSPPKKRKSVLRRKSTQSFRTGSPSTKQPSNTVRLILIKPETESRIYESDTGLMSIGRSPLSTVRIREEAKEVSWNHGVIIFIGDTFYYRHVSETSSTVIHRGHKEPKTISKRDKKEYALQNHDRILIGSYEFEITFDILGTLTIHGNVLIRTGTVGPPEPH